MNSPRIADAAWHQTNPHHYRHHTSAASYESFADRRHHTREAPDELPAIADTKAARREMRHHEALGQERRRGDRGQIGGMEVLPFGFLLFVSVTLLIANAWGIVDAKLAVTAAAREAIRAYVESDDARTATAVAKRRAVETLTAYGRGGSRSSVGDPVLRGAYRRCGRVTVTVSYDLPVIALPFIGGFGNLRPVSSTFTEVIDPYRSGLEGTAVC